MTSAHKPLLLMLLVVALAVAVLTLPVREWITIGIMWIETHRTLAWIVYVLAYILATVLLIPGSILTLAAGFVFGLPLGVALVSAASVAGASCAFLVGRFLARQWVTEWVSRKRSFSALDRATQHDGFAIVILARLSPLFPFNLLNYGLGLTAVRFRDYLLASWMGMLPGTFLYVYIGTLAKDLTALTSGEIDGGSFGRILLIAGFVATLILTVLITRKATQVLGNHLQQENADVEPS